jgi:uncharacterized protein YdeI (YjbR/CyaY-like superfamily)
MATTTERFHPLTRAEWRAWLKKNHKRDQGVWLVTYKKATGQPRVEYDDAVEEALCFGWVDSKPAKLDDERSMLWFAPRKAKTGWSAPNQKRVAKMIAEGLMHASGLAKVEAAKADGSWGKLDAIERLEIPDDLAAMFDNYPGSRDFFEAFPRSVQAWHSRMDFDGEEAGNSKQTIGRNCPLGCR